jgi:hypothetical protein
MTAPTEGYPDYQRMSLSSGYLLGSGSGDIPNTIVVFQGYVGSWGYINEYFQNLQSTDYYQVQVLYFSDATFSTLVAQQLGTRGGANVGARQWPVLTPWVKIQVAVAAPHVADNNIWTFYGSNQLASSAQLGDLDVPILHGSNAIPTNTTILMIPDHIIPGPAILSVSEAALGSYYTELDYFEYGSLSWLVFLNINDFCYAGGATLKIALPDAPIRARVHNGASVTNTIGVYIMAEM